MFRVVCVDGVWLYRGPSEGEICFVESDITMPNGKVYYYLMGYESLMFSGERVMFISDSFRPIDEQFGERIASEIEEEINQEELVIK